MSVPLIQRHGDALWFKAKAKGLKNINESWNLWTGKWAVVSGLDSGVLVTHLSGNLTKTDVMGEFYGHANATQMFDNVPEGRYQLVCKVYCSTIDYERTFAVESLTINEQGIE